MQQQRQQILQRQHLQLQQLEANNRFQEVFATATIIQAHPHPHPHPREPPPKQKSLLLPSNSSIVAGGDPQQQAQQQQQLPNNNMETDAEGHLPLLLDTSPPADLSGMGHSKRKTHRGHYKHHRARAGGPKKLSSIINTVASSSSGASSVASSTLSTTSGDTSLAATAATLPHGYMDTPLNPAAGTIVQPPQLQLYTSMPIPLILSPSEEKRPSHHAHGHVHGERRGGGTQSGGRRRTTTASVSGYEAQTYLNPFLTGELIFEK
ncbi:uncharacterized protein LOC110179495 [Drosophila serrata]|uniref:uncharacterized protein LOC110179495 n=1 Tax=Drosophila serrata TaxID=7274 RepID=UPI000A1D2886|nr:uncharacterized protein LOC110179495 [Drosophila serrata]